ncbi:RES family NAD+ phosphorylase [Chitinophaga sp.]|uniref:RES family NAD+ phosphorylase n=1 Tax=Chitinophaga sp. TaxID=1869181 RepID=UPI0031CFFEED
MRLFKLGHWEEAYDLKGAYLESGRWNLAADSCIYVFDSWPLCILESNIYAATGKLPPTMVISELDVPDGSCELFDEESLPPHWREEPRPPAALEFGSAVLQAGRTLVVGFPSIYWPGQKNYLLNPKHELMKEVSIVKVDKCSY